MNSSHEEKSFTKLNNDAKKQNTLKFKSNIQYDNIFPTINMCCSKKKLGSYN